MALIWRNYNFRIYPTKHQEQLMEKLFYYARFVYNHYVEVGRNLFELQGVYPMYNENLKTLPEFINANPFLKEADPESLLLALRNLDRAYKKNHDYDDYKPPRFKSKTRGKQSYITKTRFGRSIINKNTIKLPILGFVKIVLHRPIENCFTPLFITVIRRPSWKYEVSIAMYAPDYLYEQSSTSSHKASSNINEVSRSVLDRAPDERCNKLNSVGLDFSMPDLLVDSEGLSACYPHFYKQSLKNISREQRKLAHCQQGSNNYQKQRIIVARKMQKCANQRLDFQHKLSRMLSNKYDLVSIEDLSIKSMVKNSNLGKSAYDDGWYKFVSLLDYKLTESGKYLQKVSRWFPSSRLCSNCGDIRKDLDLSERVFSCSCGYTESRDVNAAINIKREGERLYNKNQNRNNGI